MALRKVISTCILCGNGECTCLPSPGKKKTRTKRIGLTQASTTLAQGEVETVVPSLSSPGLAAVPVTSAVPVVFPVQANDGQIVTTPSLASIESVVATAPTDDYELRRATTLLAVSGLLSVQSLLENRELVDLPDSKFNQTVTRARVAEEMYRRSRIG